MIRPAFAPAASDGINLHRVITPAAAIPAAFLLPQNFTELPPETTHIVLTAAYADPATFKTIRATGIKVVLDIDDHWHVPPHNSRYARLQASNYAALVPQAIKDADIVWCASKPLLDACLPLNKNSHYIPNTYATHWQVARSQGRRFGYVATAADHLQDAELMRKAFTRLGRELSTAQIGWCGMRNSDQDLKMRDLLELAGYCFMAQYLPSASYWWHFQSMDVALAPLAPTPFNGYKSALKAIEAGATGCALICSDQPPYSDFIHNQNCLKATTQMDWYRHITDLHANPSKAYDLSCSLQEYVKTMFSPEDWATQRLQTLQ